MHVQNEGGVKDRLNNVKKTALFANVGFPKEKSSSEMLLHKERTTYMETDDGQMDYNLWKI